MNIDVKKLSDEEVAVLQYGLESSHDKSDEFQYSAAFKEAYSKLCNAVYNEYNYRRLKFKDFQRAEEK